MTANGVEDGTHFTYQQAPLKKKKKKSFEEDKTIAAQEEKTETS